MAELIDFLEDRMFSNALNVSFPDQPYMTRIEFLEKICTQKNVVHIGFADHLEVIENKIKNNQYLHKRLLNVAKRCFGIDINCNAVEFVKTKYNMSDVYCLDVLVDDLPEAFFQIKWDYVLLPEIIEHVDNPVIFLSQIKVKFQNICDYVIITTPNAFRISNFEYALRGMELINSDHRYWFTPYTLMKVVTKAGLRVVDIYFADSFVDERNRVLTTKIPLLREDLILMASF
ncbi:MAG: class I SAM-dependent methyltransferase [Fervidobacterium sp.]